MNITQVEEIIDRAFRNNDMERSRLIEQAHSLRRELDIWKIKYSALKKELEYQLDRADELKDRLEMVTLAYEALATLTNTNNNTKEKAKLCKTLGFTLVESIEFFGNPIQGNEAKYTLSGPGIAYVDNGKDVSCTVICRIRENVVFRLLGAKEDKEFFINNGNVLSGIFARKEN